MSIRESIEQLKQLARPNERATGIVNGVILRVASDSNVDDIIDIYKLKKGE